MSRIQVARNQPALAKAAAVSLASGARLIAFNSFMLKDFMDVDYDRRMALVATIQKNGVVLHRMEACDET